MNFVVVFSGQGLQSSKHLQEIRATAEELGLTSALDPLLSQLSAIDANADAIFDNKFAQPFIFILQYLRWQKIKAHLPIPELFAGYSLGEASAFCCSTEMELSHSLDLISTRADLMSLQANQESGLISIQGLNHAQLEPLLNSTNTEVSIKLNEAHFIIGGIHNNLQQLIQYAKQQGAQHSSKLKVSIPSHTSFLHNAADQFSQYLNQLPARQMRIPLISASAGQKYSHHQQAISILSEQLDHPLDWHKCMATLREYQPDVILEIGPGNALTKMINETIPHIHARSVDDFSHLDGVQNWLMKFI